jgi:hypothetical protein
MPMADLTREQIEKLLDFNDDLLLSEQVCGNDERAIHLARLAFAIRQLLSATEWKPIETAPKDGTEILCWREDCDVFMARWSCAVMFMTDSEIEESGMSDEDLHEMDWFYADFIHGGRLDDAPTHWLPLPYIPDTAEKTDE